MSWSERQEVNGTEKERGGRCQIRGRIGGSRRKEKGGKEKKRRSRRGRRRGERWWRSREIAFWWRQIKSALQWRPQGRETDWDGHVSTKRLLPPVCACVCVMWWLPAVTVFKSHTGIFALTLWQPLRPSLGLNVHTHTHTQFNCLDFQLKCHQHVLTGLWLQVEK